MRLFKIINLNDCYLSVSLRSFIKILRFSLTVLSSFATALTVLHLSILIQGMRSVYRLAQSHTIFQLTLDRSIYTHTHSFIIINKKYASVVAASAVDFILTLNILPIT